MLDREERTVQIGVVIFEVLPILKPLRIFVNGDSLSFPRRETFVVRSSKSCLSTDVSAAKIFSFFKVSVSLRFRRTVGGRYPSCRVSFVASPTSSFRVVNRCKEDRSPVQLIFVPRRYLGHFLVGCRIGDLPGGFRDFIRCLLRLFAELRTEIRRFFQYIALKEMYCQN